MSEQHWIDVTSYSRDDKQREPKTWEQRVGDLHVIVTRHIRHPGSWLIRCDQLGVEYDAGDIPLAKAQLRAVQAVQARAELYAMSARSLKS